MISVAAEVGYIHEPFNSAIRIGVNPRPTEFWFACLSDADAETYCEIFRDILEFKYPFAHNASRTRTARDLAKLIKDQGLFAYHRIRNDRPLIKDPIAFFSSEWLAGQFDMQVVVLIRHPAAFCSSLKLMNWEFDFNNFLRQPLLMEKYLYPYEKEIKEFTRKEKDIIDQGILLWNCIHLTVKKYQERNADWVFVRHEDLSLDPCDQFRMLYETLDLKFTKRVKNIIEETSGIHNPVEQVPKKQFKRDSRKNIHNWKNRLSQAEVERIRLQTTDLSSLFYTDSEW
jgi:hypothetical protein